MFEEIVERMKREWSYTHPEWGRLEIYRTNLIGLPEDIVLKLPKGSNPCQRVYMSPGAMTYATLPNGKKLCIIRRIDGYAIGPAESLPFPSDEG